MAVNFNVIIPEGFENRSQLLGELTLLQNTHPIDTQLSISENRSNLILILQDVDKIASRYLKEGSEPDLFVNIKEVYLNQYRQALAEMFNNDIRIIITNYSYSVDYTPEKNIANCEFVTSRLQIMSDIYSDLYPEDYFKKLIQGSCNKVIGVLNSKISKLKGKILVIEMKANREYIISVNANKENTNPRKVLSPTGYKAIRFGRLATSSDDEISRIIGLKNVFLQRHYSRFGRTS